MAFLQKRVKIHLERKTDKNRALVALLIMYGDTGQGVVDSLALAGVLTTARDGTVRPRSRVTQQVPGIGTGSLTR